MASFAQEPKNAQHAKRAGQAVKNRPASSFHGAESQSAELEPIAGAPRVTHDFGRVSVHSGCSCGVCDKCRRKLYRKAADSEETGPASGETTPQVDAALSSPGRPLDAVARSYFEPRFGHDFSRVRVHVDDEAVSSVQAHAFTVGEHIVFAANRYCPSTLAGRQLLAHELTHVVQQSNPGSSGATRSLEAEAHAAGDRVSSGHAVSITGATGNGAVQRDEDEDAAADVRVIAKENGRVAVVLMRKGRIVQGYAEIKPPQGMSAADAAAKINIRVTAAVGNGLPQVDVFVPPEWGRQPVNPKAKVEVKDTKALAELLEKEKRDAERQEKVRQIRELYRQFLEDYSYLNEKFGGYPPESVASLERKTDDQVLDLIKNEFFYEWLQRRQKKRDFQEFKRRANEAGYDDPVGVKEMYKVYREPGVIGIQVQEKELHDIKYDPAHALEKNFASPLLLKWMATNPQPIDVPSDSGPVKMYVLSLPDGNIATLTPAEYAKLRQTAKNTIETQLNTIQNSKDMYQGVKADRDQDAQDLDLLFGAKLEGKNWSKIDDLVKAGRAALKSGDLAASLQYIAEAEKEGDIARKEYNRFLHNREVGAEVTLQGLEIVKTGSEIVLAVGTIPLGGEGLVIVTGKGVGESLALAALKQGYGEHVDWKDVGFDVGTQVATALVTHGLSKLQALGPNNPIMKAFRESAGAQLGVDAMQSILLDSATYASKRAYEEARGRGEKFTSQDFLNHVQAYLSDPTGLPLDVIKAQAMRYGGELMGKPGAHAEGAPGKEGAAGKEAAPGKEASADRKAAPAPENAQGAPAKTAGAPEKASLRIEVSGAGQEGGQKRPAGKQGEHAPDPAPSIREEDAKAKKDLGEVHGERHHVVVTDEGVGRCSPGPCPVIDVEFAKELDAFPKLKEWNQKVQDLRKTNPNKAADEGAALIRACEAARNNAAKAEAAGGGGDDPAFTLGVGKEKLEKIKAGDKDFVGDRRLTFDIDEVLPVGAKGIKPQRAYDRALDPGNRQLLDPNTNQRTKGLGIDKRELGRGKPIIGPKVSVTNDPHSILTKRFSEVHELNNIFERAVASVKEPQKMTATELKAAINRETRRIITEDPGPDAVAVRQALTDMGFERLPGIGWVMVKPPAMKLE